MNNLTKGFIFIFITVFLPGCADEYDIPEFEELNAPRAVAERRSEFLQNAVVNTIQANLRMELNPSTEKNYLEAFWGMGLTNYSSEQTFIAIKNSFQKADSLSSNFRRGLLEIVYQLYPSSFGSEVDKIFNETSDPKIFAMAVNYLIRNGYSGRKETYYLPELYHRFEEWRKDPILYMLEKSIAPGIDQSPPLIDLLRHNFGDDKTIVFSLQRKNRDHTGLAVIRKGNGEFVRTDNERIFAVPHFARSLSNLPWYITNGNTPPGIFSIRGIGISENEFIGRTPNLQLTMPFESEPSVFFHDENIVTPWSSALYSRLIPETWKNYTPIFGSYYAGEAGRTEIIAHGTTINPDYYIGETYYPNTPSLGCLTALELWDGESGNVILSYQWELIKSYVEAGNSEGYLIVVELDDKAKPVLLEEVAAEIFKAEKMKVK